MNVVFSTKFLDDIKKVGNNLIISKFYLEDYRSNGYSLSDITNLTGGYSGFPIYGQQDDTEVEGIWDPRENIFRTFFTLPKDSIIVHKSEGEEIITSNEVKIIRFFYNSYINKNLETAFILIENINGTLDAVSDLEVFSLSQIKNIFTIDFPTYTVANIKASKISDDTDFLEGPGVEVGINLFKSGESEKLVSRNSYYKYYRVKTIKSYPNNQYIDSNGLSISNLKSQRVYTRINISCSNIVNTVTPPTRPSLNLDGGIIRIHGTAYYREYEIIGNEAIYIGTGCEAIDGIPNAKLVEIPRENGLIVTGIDGFYLEYGKYIGQADPSTTLRAKITYYNPLTKQIEDIYSGNLKITQSSEVVSEWDVYDRTTEYYEPTTDYGNIPVYLFTYEAGIENSFKIQTTLRNISLDDFVWTFEDPILEELFEYSISPIRSYPITRFIVTLRTKSSNLDPEKWRPIIEGESVIKLATIELRDYGYSESFYMIQGPKVDPIVLKDIDGNIVNSIVMGNTQEISDYYFPFVEEGELGERNTWKILERNPDIRIEEDYGVLGINNEPGDKLVLKISDIPETIEAKNYGNLIIGRVKESEALFNFEYANWRNIIGLAKIEIPVSKLGVDHILTVVEKELYVSEINLYSITIKSNGPVACWIDYYGRINSDMIHFFDPSNTTTKFNHYYLRDFDYRDGVELWIAVDKVNLISPESILAGLINFAIIETEPEWGDERPDIFDDTVTCKIYQTVPENNLDYTRGKNSGFIFLGSYVSEPIKYIATRTPIDSIEELTHSSGRIQNPISFVNLEPEPLMNIVDYYKYHQRIVINNNSLVNYYPIAPGAIYNTYLNGYPDNKKYFYIFRKALDPLISLTSETHSSNTIFLPSDSSSESLTVSFYSRYEIRMEDFIDDIDPSFAGWDKTVNSISAQNSSYRYRYNITLVPRESNTGPQRLLGTLKISSRIYRDNFINVLELDNLGIPYDDYTQREIDEIVPPNTITFTIYQRGRGGGGETGNIEVSGNEGSVKFYGEVRPFTIISDVEIENPKFTGINNCFISESLKTGFNLNVESRLKTFTPVIPSKTDTYTQYFSSTKSNPSTCDVTIIPKNHNIENYVKNISLIQEGLSTGLVLGIVGNKTYPMLYLDQSNTVSVNVGSNNYLDILVGIFPLDQKIIDGSIGKTKGINIIANQEGCQIIDYSDVCEYYESIGFKGNKRLNFSNIVKTDKPQYLSFTITYGLIQITLGIEKNISKF